MKENFEGYLKEMGFKKGILERIERDIYPFFEKICPEEIEEIFVEDYLRNNGSRDYDSLFFFSKNFMLESKLFITDDDFFISSLNGIRYIRIQKENYDFENYNEFSRFTINLSIRNDVLLELKSTSFNCSKLNEIFNKYLINKLEK